MIEAKNSYKNNLESYIIHQIKDEEGRIIHIDWTKVFSPGNGTFTINHICDVLKNGTYTVEVFILNNLVNPIPYTEKFVDSIII